MTSCGRPARIGAAGRNMLLFRPPNAFANGEATDALSNGAGVKSGVRMLGSPPSEVGRSCSVVNGVYGFAPPFAAVLERMTTDRHGLGRGC
jgi:hypothetical protein